MIILPLNNDEYSQANELYKKEPLGFMRQTGLAITYNKLGQYDKAQQCLDTLIEENGEGASYQYGQIYAQWGEPEKALDALGHAWKIGDPGLLLMYMDKHLDPIRDQPRFIALLEKWQNLSSH